MNAVRGVISFFMLTVVMFTLLGWRWTAGLPSPKMEAARVVLVISGLAAAGALALIWSAKPQRSV